MESLGTMGRGSCLLIYTLLSIVPFLQPSLETIKDQTFGIILLLSHSFPSPLLLLLHLHLLLLSLPSSSSSFVFWNYCSKLFLNCFFYFRNLRWTIRVHIRAAWLEITCLLCFIGYSFYFFYSYSISCAPCNSLSWITVLFWIIFSKSYVGGKISKLLTYLKLSSFCLHTLMAIQLGKISKSFSLRMFWLFLHGLLASPLANQRSGARFSLTLF